MAEKSGHNSTTQKSAHAFRHGEAKRTHIPTANDSPQPSKVQAECADCGQEFFISFKEKQQFKAKQLVLPKRCPACRKLQRTAGVLCRICKNRIPRAKFSKHLERHREKDLGIGADAVATMHLRRYSLADVKLKPRPWIAYNAPIKPGSHKNGRHRSK